MSKHEILGAIADGFARLVELAPHFDEATIPVDQDEYGDWARVGEDLRDAMNRENSDNAEALGLKT